MSSGEVTPENLIAAMGELTGWDLTLSEDDPVTTGKGGMTVSFAPEECHLHRPAGGAEGRVPYVFVRSALLYHL